MKPDENYSKAIDILVAENLDWKGMCVALAKKAPDLFVKLYSDMDDTRVPKLFGINIDFNTYTTIGAILKVDGKVPAIKALRSVCHCGLKEAKDYVEQAY